MSFWACSLQFYASLFVSAHPSSSKAAAEPLAETLVFAVDAETAHSLSSCKWVEWPFCGLYSFQKHVPVSLHEVPFPWKCKSSDESLPERPFDHKQFWWDRQALINSMARPLHNYVNWPFRILKPLLASRIIVHQKAQLLANRLICLPKSGGSSERPFDSFRPRKRVKLFLVEWLDWGHLLSS